MNSREGIKKRLEDLDELAKNKRADRSKIYFRDDILKPNFKIEILDSPPQFPVLEAIRQKTPSALFSLEKGHPGFIDISTSKDDLDVIMSSFFEDVDRVNFKKYSNIVFARYGGELIDETHWDRIDAYKRAAQTMESQHLVTKHEENLGKRIAKESLIFEDLVHHPELTFAEIGKRHKTCKSEVSVIVKSLRSTGEIPSKTRVQTRRFFRLPPRAELENFFEQEWSQKGFVGESWREVLIAFKDRFPSYSSGFKDKTILNHLIKGTPLRSMQNKQIQARTSPKAFLTKQLALVYTIIKLHFAKETIIYFDQSSVQMGSFKSKSIGTSRLKPLAQIPHMPTSILFQTAITIDGFIGIEFFKNQMTSSTHVKRFLLSMVKKLREIEGDPKKPYYFVLDNAGYHKTTELKSICKEHNIYLLYTVPCSPFMNLIEDFFLKAKSVIRRLAYTSENDVLEGLARGVSLAVNSGFDWLMRKHIGIVYEKLALFRNLTN